MEAFPYHCFGLSDDHISFWEGISGQRLFESDSPLSDRTGLIAGKRSEGDTTITSAPDNDFGQQERQLLKKGQEKIPLREMGSHFVGQIQHRRIIQKARDKIATNRTLFM
jgi:hypothetical protein